MSTKIKQFLYFLFIMHLFCLRGFSDDTIEIAPDAGEHHIEFKDVGIIEFIRFVSKISQVNFIFNHEELQFNVSLSSGKSVTSADVLKALIQMLRVHGFGVSEEENYFVIHRLGKESAPQGSSEFSSDKLLAGPIPMGSRSANANVEFSVYKLKYHQGNEIEETLKKIAGDLKSHVNYPQKLIEAIQTIHWVKATNSLLFFCR